MQWIDDDAPRQLILVRDDLDMPRGKLAAQVAHASDEWIRLRILDTIKPDETGLPFHDATITFTELEKAWLEGDHTKIVCRAKDKQDLLRIEQVADSFGMFRGADWFRIYDNCFTCLEPEEANGTTLTAIGFVPLPKNQAKRLSKKYQLLN